MMQSAIVLDDAMLLQMRLRRFMSWLLAAFFTLSLLINFMSLPVPTVNRMLGTASVYGVVAALLLARFVLLHRPVAAITTISTAFFCLAMADVVLLPRALPVMIFLPVMAIAVALPYLTERALLGLS